MGCSFFAHNLTSFPFYYTTKKVDTHTFVSVYFHFTGATLNRVQPFFMFVRTVSFDVGCQHIGFTRRNVLYEGQNDWDQGM